MKLGAAMADGAVRLEPLREEHREPLRLLCEEDREIWTIYPMSFAGPDFDRNFDACLAGESQAAFAIYGDGALAGMSSFLSIDEANRTVEIGRTYVAPSQRGTGLNTKVKRLMLDRAFGAGFTRVEFRIDTRNGRSMAAVEKLGAKRDGILRRNRITWTGYVRDTAVFSILADEWPSTAG